MKLLLHYIQNIIDINMIANHIFNLRCLGLIPSVLIIRSSLTRSEGGEEAMDIMTVVFKLNNFSGTNVALMYPAHPIFHIVCE